METTIRKAETVDAEILAFLNADVQRLHADAYPLLFKQPGSDDSMVQYMADALANTMNHFYIVEADGKPAAYIFAVILERPENAFKFADRQVYINQISVKPEFQGMGCGSRLMQAVRELARDNDIHTFGVDTWAFNEKALAFFKAQGFTPNNIRMWQTLE